MRIVPELPAGLVIAGGVALGVATASLGTAVFGAVWGTPEIDPMPAPVGVAGSIELSGSERGADTADRGLEGDLRGPRATAVGTPSSLLGLAVQNDLFLPGRTRPSERYRLSGEFVTTERPIERREVPEAPDLRVHGTAQIGDGGLVMVALGDDDDDEASPQVLSVGESMGGYRLASVGDEIATFVGPAGRLVVPVTPGSAAEPERNNNNRGRNDRERELRDAEGRLQEMIINFQQRGGRNGRGFVRINGDAVVIPSRGGGRGRGGGGNR